MTSYQGVLFVIVIAWQQGSWAERSFGISYNNNTFIKDGKPFRYISGTMHYFRVPHQFWEDRLLKMKAAGLNTIQTYIEWNSHEPYPGVYKFEDDLDVEAFIKLAGKIGLLVLIRPGPYIDAERDMGGLPFWLLSENPTIKLRTMDATYIKFVERWYSVLLSRLKPLLYENNGPIIGMQVENEYGSYESCDFTYTNHLRNILQHYLGNDVYLYSTDGGSDSFLKCGKVPAVYATVDFGTGSNVNNSFQAQRNHQPWGPLVNSEYYTGWLDHWGYPHAEIDTKAVIQMLDEILSTGASVNFYMFHGGTSFGFTSGANMDGSNYVACPTSYDYGAPITEAGDVTELYYAIREVISLYTPDPLPPVPPNQPKHSYGPIEMKSVAPLLRVADYISLSKPIESADPITFESIGQASGFILYITKISGKFMDPVLLKVSGIHDRGYVFLDNIPVGILNRQDSITELPLSVRSGQMLAILVESQGRICFGAEINDFKGIVGSVILGSVKLSNWTQIPLPFNDTNILKSLLEKQNWVSDTQGNSVNLIWAPKDDKVVATLDAQNKARESGNLTPDLIDPAFYIGNFVIPSTLDMVMDTFLRLDGWSKGIVFINGFNLGRYWPEVGPQVTLYVPKTLLKPHPQDNTIILLELQSSPCRSNDSKCQIKLVDEPELNGETPYTTARGIAVKGREPPVLLAKNNRPSGF